MSKFYTVICCLIFPFFAFGEGDIPAKTYLEALKNSNGKDITGTVFSTDDGKEPSVAIYEITKDDEPIALYWHADMDVDCDGESDQYCNKQTDPWFQPQISVGKGIHASKTPFFVIPIESELFKYTDHKVFLGNVGAVIYKDKVVYGPFLDACGNKKLIGEASYALVKALGVNPDPKVGGTDEKVTYIAFAGYGPQLLKSEYTNHQIAIDIGNSYGKKLLPTKVMNTLKQLNNHSHILYRNTVKIFSNGVHQIKILTPQGKIKKTFKGHGSKVYSLLSLPKGVYLLQIQSTFGTTYDTFISQ